MGSPTSRAEARHIIAATPFFSEVLTEEEIDKLAGRAIAIDADPGSELIKEDELGASMFIIVAGQVDVVTGKGKAAKRIARLGPGDFVGEMSLMTGAHRSATVTAATPVRAVEVSRTALAPILDASPELVHRFAAILGKRQSEIDRAYGGHGRLLGVGDFAELIGSFFGGTI